MPASNIIRVVAGTGGRGSFDNYLVTMAAVKRAIGRGPPVLWSGLARMLSPILPVEGTSFEGVLVDRDVDVRLRLLGLDEEVFENDAERLAYADFVRSVIARHGLSAFYDLYGILGLRVSSGELDRAFFETLGTSLSAELSAWRDLRETDPVSVFSYTSECTRPFINVEVGGEPVVIVTERGTLVQRALFGLELLLPFQALVRLDVPTPTTESATLRVDFASSGPAADWVLIPCAGEPHPIGHGWANHAGNPTTLYMNAAPGERFLHVAMADRMEFTDDAVILAEDAPLATLSMEWVPAPMADSCAGSVIPTKLVSDGGTLGVARVGIAANAYGLSDDIASPGYEGRADLVAAFTATVDGDLQLLDGPHAAFLCIDTCPTSTGV